METSTDGMWPRYFEQQTDLTGCTRYDGTASRLIQKWTEFRKQYPTAYMKEALDQKISNRLKEIQSGKSEMRFECSNLI